MLLITKSNSNTYLLSYLIGTITFNEIHSKKKKKKTFNEILTLIHKPIRLDAFLEFTLKAQLARLWAATLAILGIFWATYSLKGLELGYSISETPLYG